MPRSGPDARRAGRRLAAAALAVTLVLGAATGCGRDDGPSHLDTAATEQAVEKAVDRRLETDVTRVRCPDEIVRGAGRRVACQAILAKGQGQVRLRVRQSGTDTELDIELLDAVIDRKAVADDLRRQLVDRFHRRFTVDCGSARVDVVAPRSTFTCKAEDPAGRRTVTVTVVDAAGTVRYDVGGA